MPLQCITAVRESHVLQNQWVYRGSGEEGSREYSITGQVEDGERYSFQMEVMPRKYSQSELENLYEQFGERTASVDPGEK